MTTKNAEESRAECQAAMGDRLGSMFYEIRNEVVWLHAKWSQYMQLFGEGEETVKLLNRHGAFFFWTVQESLWETMLLHVARLTDPPRTGRYENLSIQRLLEEIADPEIKKMAEPLVALCLERAEFSRTHRDKRYAHRDLTYALKEAPKPLAGVSRKHVDDILESLAALLNRLNEHYLDATFIFEFLNSNGARSLIIDLRKLERSLEPK